MSERQRQSSLNIIMCAPFERSGSASLYRPFLSFSRKKYSISNCLRIWKRVGRRRKGGGGGGNSMPWLRTRITRRTKRQQPQLVTPEDVRLHSTRLTYHVTFSRWRATFYGSHCSKGSQAARWWLATSTRRNIRGFPVGPTAAYAQSRIHRSAAA